MPITFEEVTADIDREPRADGAAPQPPQAPAQNLAAQLDEALQLKAARDERVSDR